MGVRGGTRGLENKRIKNLFRFADAGLDLDSIEIAVQHCSVKRFIIDLSSDLDIFR